MRPAFSSTLQAGAFCILLLVLLLLPVIFTKRMLPPREEIYDFVPWRMGPYPYLHEAIFEKKGDVDIAFMGGSTMYMGIGTPYVQAALSKSLGRNATVITVAWNWHGYDALYFVARDLLAHRKVNTIVFSDVTAPDKSPHAAAPYWFRFGDDASSLRGLPLQYLPQYYFASILGMPRNLLSLIRPNDPRFFFVSNRSDHDTGEIPHPSFTVGNPTEQLGSETVEIAYHYSKFVDYSPNPPASPTDACIYCPATANMFHFENRSLVPLQSHFLRMFASLARSYGTRLVMLTLPSPGQERTSYIPEEANWPAILGPGLDIVGYPPDKFYAGMTASDIDEITPDHGHLNKNGQRYFTKLITPALIKIYENSSRH